MAALDEQTARGRTPSFFARHFTGPAGIGALVSALLALVTAWLSNGASAWWISYLQDLSTTLVGIAITVWLVNSVVEAQANRLSADLRRPTEVAARDMVRKLIKRLPNELPSVDAPDSTYLNQFGGLRGQIGRLRELCDSIAPGASDIELHYAATNFGLAHTAWSESLEDLESLIRMTAPAAERAAAFRALKNNTEPLITSARKLDSRLSKLHPPPSTDTLDLTGD